MLLVERSFVFLAKWPDYLLTAYKPCGDLCGCSLIPVACVPLFHIFVFFGHTAQFHVRGTQVLVTSIWS